MVGPSYYSFFVMKPTFGQAIRPALFLYRMPGYWVLSLTDILAFAGLMAK